MVYYIEKEEKECLDVAVVDYEREKDTFTFEPVTNFSLGVPSIATAEEFEIGLLQTMIIIDEEMDGVLPEDIPDSAKIPEVPDIDMDYESDKENGSGGGGAGVLNKFTVLLTGTAYHDQYMPAIENFDFSMDVQLTGDNSGKITFYLPDLLWLGSKASRLKAPIRIKCGALTNRAKYCNNPILGTMKVRSDELDQPGGTYIMNTEERNVWYNEEDGGNIWIGDETDWISSNKNADEPCGVLAGSFTFEYTETIDGEYIKKTSTFNANCKAWEKENAMAMVTLGKGEGRDLLQLNACLQNISATEVDGHCIKITLDDDFISNYTTNGLPQGELGTCKVSIWGAVDVERIYKEVERIVYYTKSNGIQIFTTKKVTEYSMAWWIGKNCSTNWTCGGIYFNIRTTR